MPITLRDILHMEKMAAHVLAGSGGLDREIGHIAALGNRCAAFENRCADPVERRDGAAQHGVLYLLEHDVYRDRWEKLRDDLEFLHRTKSSGLVTHWDAAELTDDRMRELADRYAIPVIAVDAHFGLAEMRQCLSDLTEREAENGRNEKYLCGLVTGELDELAGRDMLQRIGGGMGKNVAAVYLMAERLTNPAVIEPDPRDVVLPFFGGAVCLLTFDEGDEEDVFARAKRYIRVIRPAAPAFTIGISTVHEGLERAGRAVREAVCACARCEVSGKSICRYDGAGAFELLTEVRDPETLRRFRDVIYGPVLEYEQSSGTELMDVMKLYVSTGGDFSRIAKRLYIHETTVRYRIGRIQELLGIKDRLTLFADARTAIYADCILEHPVMKMVL